MDEFSKIMVIIGAKRPIFAWFNMGVPVLSRVAMCLHSSKDSDMP